MILKYVCLQSIKLILKVFCSGPLFVRLCWHDWSGPHLAGGVCTVCPTAYNTIYQLLMVRIAWLDSRTSAIISAVDSPAWQPGRKHIKECAASFAFLNSLVNMCHMQLWIVTNGGDSWSHISVEWNRYIIQISALSTII